MMAQPSQTSYDVAQYGAPVGDYPGGGASRVLVLLGGLVVFGLGAFFVALAGYGLLNPDSGQSNAVVGVILGLVFILASLYPFITLFTWRGAHAQLFERGFVISRAGKTASGRWEDVANVMQYVVQQRYYGIPLYTSYRYDITMVNGEKARVNNAFARARQLGDNLQRLSANALLPRAIAAYNSGATLPFGKLSVSQAGISNGSETLPWADLNQLTLANGVIYVMRKGKRLRWASAPIRKTPNIYVLTALVSYVQRGVR